MSKLREQVEQFHRTFNIPNLPAPGVPEDAIVRLRAKLVIEEAFEFLEALFIHKEDFLMIWKGAIKAWIDRQRPSVDLPEAADALADLDYVVEGSRLAFGIDGAPIADAVHAANMAKAAPEGVVRNIDGKVMKPDGWAPPDVAAELEKQGWRRP